MPIPYKDLPPDVRAEIRAYYVERAKSIVAAFLIVVGLGWLLVLKMAKGLDMTVGDGVPAIVVFAVGLVVGYSQKAHRDRRRG